jgi:hypothetical protein
MSIWNHNPTINILSMLTVLSSILFLGELFAKEKLSPSSGLSLSLSYERCYIFGLGVQFS